MALPECATPTVTGLVGMRASLPCLGTGTPAPRRTWTRDGINVLSPESSIRDRVMLVNEGEVLIINDLEETDGGVYNCFLFNIIADLNMAFNDSSDVILEIQREFIFT